MHHAPWAGDGGSLDTRYILQCLPMLLSSSVYEPVHYDAIIFNAGLHDIDCCDFPKEVIKKTYTKASSILPHPLFVSPEKEKKLSTVTRL